jgi:glycerate kinase
MRVLLAFDKFKESLTAPEACAAAAAGLRAARPDWEIDLCPLADGGDGFSALLTAALGGRLVATTVPDARGRPAVASHGLVPLAAVPPAARALLPGLPESGEGELAVVDTAAACGLAALAEADRDPRPASSRGTGELLRHAAAGGARALLLGLGGSATHDLGLGALAALGIEPVDTNGAVVEPPAPMRWADIAGWRGALPDGFPPLFLAVDVDNPLCGPRGAAACFAPQKGLPPAEVPALDAAGREVALRLCAALGRPAGLLDEPGAGAAGGLGFGLRCGAGGVLAPGAALVAAWLGLDARLAAADLVLTGEGSFDATSLGGKGPGDVVARALAAGKRVEVFAGRIGGGLAPRPGLGLHEITPAGQRLAEALAGAADNLRAGVQKAFSVERTA